MLTCEKMIQIEFEATDLLTNFISGNSNLKEYWYKYGQEIFLIPNEDPYIQLVFKQNVFECRLLNEFAPVAHHLQSKLGYEVVIFFV